LLRALRGPRVASALKRASALGRFRCVPRGPGAARVTRDDRALLPEPKEVFGWRWPSFRPGALSQEAATTCSPCCRLCATRGSLELVRQG